MIKEHETVIGTFSERGFVTSAESLLATLLGNYYLTEEQQSLIYRDDIISLPKTYYQHINDPKGFRRRVSMDLEILLRLYFEEIDVDSEVRFDETKPSHANIAVFASVIDKYGKKISLGNVIRVDETGFREFIGINNYGDRYKYMG